MLKCPCGKGCKSPITEESFDKFPQHVRCAFAKFRLWYAEELLLRKALGLSKEEMPEDIIEALETIKKAAWPDHGGKTLGDSNYIKHLGEYAVS